MNFIEIIKKRRSVYNLDKQLPVFEDKIIEIIKESLLYVPDAFDMKSQRVLVVSGRKNDDFWNAVYDTLVVASGGRFSRDRTDSFMDGYGTILYFYDREVVEEYKKKYAMYADKFHDWVMQSNAMLQFVIWTALANVGVGASLQHYNPVIDDMVREMFRLPKSWVLVAEMPFGGIAAAPEPRAKEDVDGRVKIVQ